MGNLALLQVQAAVVSFVAACVSIGLGMVVPREPATPSDPTAAGTGGMTSGSSSAMGEGLTTVIGDSMMAIGDSTSASSSTATSSSSTVTSLSSMTTSIARRLLARALRRRRPFPSAIKTAERTSGLPT